MTLANVGFVPLAFANGTDPRRGAAPSAALAKAAKADPASRTMFDAKKVGRYLQVRGAEGDAIEQFEDAHSVRSVERSEAVDYAEGERIAE